MSPAERALDPAARAVLLRNLGGAVVGGLLIASVEFAVTRASVQYGVIEQLAWLARLAVHWCLSALPVGAAMAIIEQRAHGARPSPPAYAVAVVAGAVSGAVVVALHSRYGDRGIAEAVVGYDLPLADRFLYGLWQLGFWGAVGAVLHATDLRRRLGLARLQSEELSRLRSERELADARLASLHAQVEPQFLLATLGRVERLYEHDPAAADRVLDALIGFLREATPLLRRQASTLGDECRLLEAYLGMLGDRRSTARTTAVGLAAGTAAVPMPPGLLVSLAQRVVDEAPGGEPRFDVRSTRRPDGTDVELRVAGPGIGASATALEPALEAATRRLLLSHGPGSSISAHPDGPDGLTLWIALLDHRGD